ncbi:hypothetical protein GCM10010452_66770 [Crossiella cryophila]
MTTALPVSTRDTVALDTPARAAMSVIVAFLPATSPTLPIHLGVDRPCDGCYIPETRLKPVSSQWFTTPCLEEP